MRDTTNKENDMIRGLIGTVFFVAIFALLLSGCNIYVDSGKVSKSNIEGYKQYSNKTINVAVLTPAGWRTRVSIGGEYVMTAPDTKKKRAENLLLLLTPLPLIILLKRVWSSLWMVLPNRTRIHDCHSLQRLKPSKKID